jgi:hypothetical protein
LQLIKFHNWTIDQVADLSIPQIRYLTCDIDSLQKHHTDLQMTEEAKKLQEFMRLNAPDQEG